MATLLNNRIGRQEERDLPGDPAGTISHNLNGQKLGRKGRDTRDRILAATTQLLDEAGETPISLSAVARRASLGMTSLYLYFNDLTELLLAVLEPVLAQAETSYLGMLRSRWPDEELADRCLAFVSAYHEFWITNSRILHLRNAMSDAHDLRMMQHRVASAQPMIGKLILQMDGDPADSSSPDYAMANMLMSGIERAATVWTDAVLSELLAEGMFRDAGWFRQPAARMLELGISDARSAARTRRALA